jgi:DNA-binding response OmpR family regulator
MRILSVNCTVITGKVLSCTLGRFGHSVCSVTRCEDTEVLLQRESFDGIILDTGVPGSECSPSLIQWYRTALLRPAGSKIPCIVLVDRSDSAARLAAESIGAAGIVEKPFTRDVLLSAVIRCFFPVRSVQKNTACITIQSISG